MIYFKNKLRNGKPSVVRYYVLAILFLARRSHGISARLRLFRAEYYKFLYLGTSLSGFGNGMGRGAGRGEWQQIFAHPTHSSYLANTNSTAN